MSGVEPLEALYGATREIGLSDSLDRLLDEVIDRAQGLIGFDHCAFMLYDPATRTLSVERLRGYGDRADDLRRLSLAKGEGLSGVAAAEGRPVRVGDVREDDRYVEGLPSARSNLAVPMMAGGELAGVINAESERPHAFTEAHEQLLTVLGAQAGLAILASRARERLRNRIQQLDGLYRISRLASEHRNLDETLRGILQVAGDVVPEGRVAILLRDPETDSLRVRAAEGYSQSVMELEIPMHEGITGRCAKEGRTVVVDDVEKEEGYIPGVEGGRSEIAVPLRAEGEVIGVLDAEATRPSAYGPEERQTLAVIAQQVAAVVQTVQLYEQTREMAITDSLTGLHNRRHFFTRLKHHLNRAERYDERLALLLLDADDLKQINDRHGHVSGDRALERIASFLRGCLRASDEIARIGGDEFAALLLSAEEERALRVARRIQSGLRDLHLRTDEGTRVGLSVSIGMAFWPDDARDGRLLFQQADEALYAAKDLGRSRVVRSEDPDGDVDVSGGDEPDRNLLD